MDGMSKPREELWVSPGKDDHPWVGGRTSVNEIFLKEVPRRVAGVHQTDTGQEGGLEGTFQLSLQHVQRPRMFILW